MYPSPAQLGRALSKCKAFEHPIAKEEQYSTPPEIAGHALSVATQLGDIQGKEVSDLGAGTGILGIGALLCEAKKVTFIEQDTHAASQIHANIAQYGGELGAKSTIIVGKIPENSPKSETIVMNPPFGTKQKHADKPFWEVALKSGALAIYGFAKTSTARFVEKIAADHHYHVSHRWTYDWPLAKTQMFHTKHRKHIQVTLFRLEK